MSGLYQVGESFIGDGANAAHINTVLGSRSGAVGTAWATALATPSPGHVPFMAVMAPGLPVKPATLFVTKAAPEVPTNPHTHPNLPHPPVSAGDGAERGIETPAVDAVPA